jgi:hypothetical protein
MTLAQRKPVAELVPEIPSRLRREEYLYLYCENDGLPTSTPQELAMIRFEQLLADFWELTSSA